MSRARCLRCSRTVLQDRFLCALHTADVLFAASIRARNRCWCESRHCCGRLQCAHVMSRRFHATRWDPANAKALCGWHHIYYTEHPHEWEVLCRERGVAWDMLYARAHLGDPMDPEQVINDLEAA